MWHIQRHDRGRKQGTAETGVEACDNIMAVIFLYLSLQSLFKTQCQMNDVWAAYHSVSYSTSNLFPYFSSSRGIRRSSLTSLSCNSGILHNMNKKKITVACFEKQLKQFRFTVRQKNATKKGSKSSVTTWASCLRHCDQSWSWSIPMTTKRLSNWMNCKKIWEKHLFSLLNKL